ncbi:porin, partial [Flavobacterium sp.]|uniref:porin n=1 Tax=Flavobacterium sp. TaxID=239 RepID=UPI0037B0B34F
MKGNFSPEWEYRLQTDFAVSPKIIDAYITYKPFDALKFTAGQFIIPFSLESTTSDNTLETIDRAQVSGLVARNKDALGDQNGRDLGIQVSGSLLQTPSNRFLLDYYIAYFNGQGINLATDANNFKDVAARLVVHPFEFLDLGGSYTNGYDNWVTTAAKAATYNAPIGSVITIKTLATNAITSNNNHSRIGADIAFTYNDFNFKAEYIEAQEGTYLVGTTVKTLIKNGWYAQAGYYVLPKKLQFVVKYDTYDPT